MDTKTFRDLYASSKSHDTITIACEGCGGNQEVTKTRALETIKAKGRYKCRPCGLKEMYAENPRSDETKKKISEGHMGKPKSPEAVKKQADSRRDMFKTERGMELKKMLSEKAAKQHANQNMERTRRRGFYESKKNESPLSFSSSYELKAFLLLEEDETVSHIQAQHYFERDGRHRSLDIVVTHSDGSTLGIEVKPESRLQQDAVIRQIDDSRWYATKKCWDFQVWTEQELGFTSGYQATLWADEYLSKMAGIDYVALRAQKNRESSLRCYYRKKNRL